MLLPCFQRGGVEVVGGGDLVVFFQPVQEVLQMVAGEADCVGAHAQ